MQPGQHNPILSHEVTTLTREIVSNFHRITHKHWIRCDHSSLDSYLPDEIECFAGETYMKAGPTFVHLEPYTPNMPAYEICFCYSEHEFILNSTKVQEKTDIDYLNSVD